MTTEQLRVLLRALHHGTIEGPLTVAALCGHGLQSAVDPLLDHMRGLDTAAVRAVVVAVIAERPSTGNDPSRS